MKKMKAVVSSLVIFLALFALVGCNDQKPNENNDSNTPPNVDVKKDFTVTLNGEKVAGSSLECILKDKDGTILKYDSVNVLEGTDLVSIEEKTIKLLNHGKVKLEFTLNGYNSMTVEFEIQAAKPALKTLTLAYTGHPFKGETLGLSVQDQDNTILDNYEINILKGADFTVKNGNNLILLDQGTVSIEVVKDGYETLKTDIEIENVLTIKELKENLSTYTGKQVNVRGLVTATYGNSFYIMDGKHGIYVYNIQANPMIGTAGDAFEYGQIAVDKKVIVTAGVENGKYGLQLSGFSNGGYDINCQVNLSTAEVTKPEAYIIKNEADLTQLVKSPELAGSRVRITGKFLSGDFSLAEQASPKSPLFKMMYGSIPYSLKFDKYGSLEKVKAYWNAQRIKENEFVTVEANFTNFKKQEITLSLCNEGTIVINESKNPNKMKIIVDSPQVVAGNEIVLKTTKVEGLTGDITYKIIDGQEFAQITGDKLRGIKAGTVKVVAICGNEESLPLEIIVTNQTYQKVNEALALDNGSRVNVRGNVVSITKFGFIIADETGYLYAYDENFEGKALPTMGDTVILKGTLSSYDKTSQKQIVSFTFETAQEKIPFAPTFNKTAPAELLKIGDAELLNGVAVEMKLKVEYSDAFGGYILFTHPELGDVKIECNSLPFDLAGSLAFGADGQVFNCKGIIIGKYLDNSTNANVYLIYLTALEQSAGSAIESLTITANKTEISLDGTTGAGRTMVTITANPFDADMSTVELVAIDNPNLVTIEYDDFTGEYKVKSNGAEGTVTLVAKSGNIESNKIVITIK